MRYNPTLNKSWRCLCGEKSKPGYWSPFPAISMYSFPVRWDKLISVPRVCQIKQLGEGRCLSELQFGDTLLQRVTHFEHCDYGGLSFHRGREPMAHSPSRSSLVILCSQNQGDVSDSPGNRSLPLALFWAHMHPLPGIFLCVLHDGIQTLLQFWNSLHCPEGWLKPSHIRHWMCFENRSNKRSCKEGKSKFTGFH